MDGNTTLNSTAVSLSNGVATYRGNRPLTGGYHNITAVYSGGGNYLGSTGYVGNQAGTE